MDSRRPDFKQRKQNYEALYTEFVARDPNYVVDIPPRPCKYSLVITERNLFTDTEMRWDCNSSDLGCLKEMVETDSEVAYALHERAGETFIVDLDTGERTYRQVVWS